MNKQEEKDLKSLLELLRKTTSTTVVKDFLKDLGLSYSASSWDKLIENRLIPHVKAGKLTKESLVSLLRDSEESGRQHVLMFETSQKNCKTLLDQTSMLKKVESLKLSSLLTEPLILDKPDEPTIADIRLENKSLAIKIVETRESQVLVDENDTGKFLTRKYERVLERAVNLFKLHDDGTLEVRIASNSSNGYRHEVERLWTYISKLIEREKFRVLSLYTAKNTIWDKRAELTDKIRYSDATLKDDFGYSLRAASNSKEADLSDNDAVISSLDSFSNTDAYCESNNIFFKPTTTGTPSKEIHLLISGEVNEFAVTAKCLKTDYDYVFNELRELNRKVS